MFVFFTVLSPRVLDFLVLVDLFIAVSHMVDLAGAPAYNALIIGLIAAPRSRRPLRPSSPLLGLLLG